MAAREVCASYIEMIEAMQARKIAGNISIKLTQLGLDLSKELCAGLALAIAKRAAELGRTIEMDMEGSGYTDATLDIFESVQRECGNCRACRAGVPASHRERPATAGAAETEEFAWSRARIANRKISRCRASPRSTRTYKRLTTHACSKARRRERFSRRSRSHDPMMVAHAQAEAARLEFAEGLNTNFR